MNGFTGAFVPVKHTLSLNSHVKIPADVLDHDLQGETVILNLNTGVYWGLDPVGTRVWQLLQEQPRVGAILEILRAEYDAAEARLRQDLLDLLTRLMENGLVEVHGEAVA